MLLAILLRCVCPEATSTSLALLCNPDAVLHRGLNRALDSMNFAQPLRFAPCPGLVIGACLGCPRSWVLMSFHLSLCKAFKLPPRPSRYLHCRCFPSVSPSPPSSVARALLRAWSPDCPAPQPRCARFPCRGLLCCCLLSCCSRDTRCGQQPCAASYLGVFSLYCLSACRPACGSRAAPFWAALTWQTPRMLWAGIRCRLGLARPSEASGQVSLLDMNLLLCFRWPTPSCQTVHSWCAHRSHPHGGCGSRCSCCHSPPP